MIKLLLLDDWIKAIDKLIGAYNFGLNPKDIDCPLCRVHRQEIFQGNKTPGRNCTCPWVVFKGIEGGCYGLATRQTQDERIARLKDWKRRILRMKRRRKK